MKIRREHEERIYKVGVTFDGMRINQFQDMKLKKKKIERRNYYKKKKIYFYIVEKLDVGGW